MDRQEWITRCSARLHAQWPRLRREQRDEVASELHGDDRWQSLEPECAVVEWLRQGIPTPEARRDVGWRASNVHGRRVPRERLKSMQPS